MAIVNIKTKKLCLLTQFSVKILSRTKWFSFSHLISDYLTFLQHHTLKDEVYKKGFFKTWARPYKNNSCYKKIVPIKKSDFSKMCLWRNCWIDFYRNTTSPFEIIKIKIVWMSSNIRYLIHDKSSNFDATKYLFK